jgi:adenylate kinase family enzyme
LGSPVGSIVIVAARAASGQLRAGPGFCADRWSSATTLVGIPPANAPKDNLLSQPPRVPGICDDDRAPLQTRDDDQECVIRRRLAAYHQQTGPVLAWYGPGVVHTVNGAHSPEQVAEAIEQTLTVGV